MSTVSDWAVVTATLVGPVLAVQAQKWVERAKESASRKAAVFATLMATRAARLGPDHVRALNAIDLVFYGRQWLGKRLRTKGEQTVLDAWKEYLDHLSEPVPGSEAATQAFLASRNELFINLLAAIAKERRYSFDRVVLKKGAYSPLAHGQLEQAQADALKGVAEVFSGRRPIKVVPGLSEKK
ncbi:DUF6680 family protein [Paraburkholderia youngii]|uniref:DUF6680 family protein n=1 Tax=Paraburkholderia youngii TaxID=2782701 RepID=UPI003D2145C6